MGNRFFPNYNEYKITSRFGNRVINGVLNFHYGIDLVAKDLRGNSATDYVLAHSAGTVKEVAFNNVSGNYILIDCGDNVEMLYCHFKDKSIVVEKGEKIKKGTTLGYMGDTGNTIGAHLHFGIKLCGKYINPEPYLDKDFLVASSLKGGESYRMNTLKLNSEGNDVTIYESIMKKIGFYNGIIDTHFGSGCLTACNNFQIKYPDCGTGGKPDGSFGPKCWDKLLSLIKG